MKSLYNYIIYTDSRYNNKKNIDGKELILNSELSERDYKFVNLEDGLMLRVKKKIHHLILMKIFTLLAQTRCMHTKIMVNGNVLIDIVLLSHYHKILNGVF